jgi:hypothetical protein
MIFVFNIAISTTVQYPTKRHELMRYDGSCKVFLASTTKINSEQIK